MKEDSTLSVGVRLLSTVFLLVFFLKQKSSVVGCSWLEGTGFWHELYSAREVVAEILAKPTAHIAKVYELPGAVSIECKATKVMFAACPQVEGHGGISHNLSLWPT